MTFEPLVLQTWVFMLFVFAAPIIYCSIKHKLRWFPANAMLLIGALALIGALEFLLSHPKPWAYEWQKAERYQVVAFWIVPREAIYTWMIPQYEAAPRYYRWVWTLESQQQLVKLSSEASEKGVPLYYEPFDAETEGGQPKLQFTPPAPPPKPSHAR